MSQIFGERLRVLRKRKGLTQAELAAWAGVSQAAENKWEHGVSEPSLETMKRMATFFGVSMDSLCGYSLEDSLGPGDNMAVMTRAFRQLTEDEQDKLIRVGRTLFAHAFDPDDQP
ncbi:MAG: helix-turn-helix transcriptional regulator [Clostridia bacterium]|nr:helix-turn-helix transcriptional regulator [Clostridia bacterium]